MQITETQSSLETRMKMTSKYLVDVRPPHYVVIPQLGISQNKPHLQPYNGEIKDGKAVNYNPNGLYGLQSSVKQIDKSEAVEKKASPVHSGIKLNPDSKDEAPKRTEEGFLKKTFNKVADILDKNLKGDELSVRTEKAKELPKRKALKKKSLDEFQKELDASFSK